MSARPRAVAIALLLAGSVQADPLPSADTRGLAWSWDQPHGNAVLRIADERGDVREFSLDASLRWSIDGLALADGHWRYEIAIAPPGPALQRGSDAREVAGGAQGALQSGAFVARGGRIAAPEFEATPRVKSAHAKDVVVADDRIVQGSICAGFDCIDTQQFDGQQIILRENNTRIGFSDTSPAAPATDWELTANESGSGAASVFSVLQVTSGAPILRLLAGAPDGSVSVTADGFGVRAPTPAQRVHAIGPDEPTLRLDQNNLAGFTPYIWDLAADESEFAVRDVTAADARPFRVAAGTSTGTLTLAPDVRVGVGTPVPATTLHVMRSDGSARLRVEDVAPAVATRTSLELLNQGAPAIALQGDTGGWTMTAGATFSMASNQPAAGTLQVTDNGDLVISGSLAQGSSRALKQAIDAVAPERMLRKIVDLPLYSWQYLADAGQARHVGPMAEDVYAAFGLGVGERSLAPGDVAGLAIAAAQALRAELASRDAELDVLLQRLETLEARAGGEK